MTASWIRKGLVCLLIAMAIFSEERAAHAEQFIEKHCRWIKGEAAGLRIELEPWMRNCVRTIFGTMRDDAPNYRQIQKALVSVARKNAKSMGLAAPIGLYGLFADRENGAEIYSCARDREQASITFGMAAAMIRRDPVLRRNSRIIDSRKTIIATRTENIWRALPREALGAQGSEPHIVIFDELQTQPDDEMIDAMVMGFGQRRQPLIFMTTTAGPDPGGVYARERQYALDVQKGLIEDPFYWSFILELAEGENWLDEAVWARINPSRFRSLASIRKDVERAKRDPKKLRQFLMYYLNHMVEGLSGWMTLEDWDASNGAVDIDALRGRPCWSAMDLSSTTDLTAICHAFPLTGGEIALLLRFFMPEENIERRSDEDQVLYRHWANQGLITLTDGNYVDLDFVFQQFLRDAETYKIQEIAYDPFRSTELVPKLQKQKLNPVKHRQGTVSMSPAMNEVERLVLAKKLRWSGHPVLRWQLSRTKVREDECGNIMPVKKTAASEGGSRGARIDGVVASIMATGRALLHEAPKKATDAYNKRGGFG